MNKVDSQIVSCDILSGTRIEDGKITNISEGTIYEFKENFNWGSREKYARIMASFANSVGGYIIFGINDEGVIVGLNGDNFEQKDSALITEYLNSIFVPKIEWRKALCTISDKKIGMLYVEESNDKPIMACANGNEVKEGDIYYRYPGETHRIKQGELKFIIEDGKRKYGVKLLEEMKMIVEEGPKDYGLLDLEQISKYKDKPVYFISPGTSGKKIEVKGANQNEVSNGIAVKVLNLDGPAKEIRVTEFANITSETIIYSFLEGKLPPASNPKGFLQRLPDESSGYIPIYFYIKMAGVSKEEAVEIIKNTKTTARARTTLIKRLTGPDNGYTSNFNQDLLKQVIKGEVKVEELGETEIRQILSSIRSLEKDYLKQYWEVMRKTIYYLYNNFYMNARMRSELRWTICYIDELFYK